MNKKVGNFTVRVIEEADNVSHFTESLDSAHQLLLQDKLTHLDPCPSFSPVPFYLKNNNQYLYVFLLIDYIYIS